jgi:hypothetical protein
MNVKLELLFLDALCPLCFASQVMSIFGYILNIELKVDDAAW